MKSYFPGELAVRQEMDKYPELLEKARKFHEWRPQIIQLKKDVEAEESQETIWRHIREIEL